MQRVRTRGIAGAGKFMLGAATAYNLKKWLNFNPKRVKTGAMMKLKEEFAMFKNNIAWLFHLRLEALKNVNP